MDQIRVNQLDRYTDLTFLHENNKAKIVPLNKIKNEKMMKLIENPINCKSIN